jgi:hypothetical protein
MKRFKTILNEIFLSESNSLDSLKNILKLNLLSDKSKAAFPGYIEVLQVGLDRKEIYNARYAESLSGILYTIGRAYRQLETKNDYIEFKRKYDLFSDDGIPYSLDTMSDLKKFVKAFPKLKQVPPGLQDFYLAVKDFPSVIDTLKQYVKKGREPKPIDPNKQPEFQKPSISFNASKKAIEFLKEATDSFQKELRQAIEKQITTTYEKIKHIEKVKDLPKTTDVVSLASIIFIQRYKVGGSILELKSDADEYVKRKIEQSVSDILDGFISKNTSKIALILEKKGLPKIHKLIHTHISQGMVENIMYFEFEDKSSFRIKSSIIYKYSSQGKLFIQYPTRFSNVVLSDGTKMSMPSEEKMIKEF